MAAVTPAETNAYATVVIVVMVAPTAVMLVIIIVVVIMMTPAAMMAVLVSVADDDRQAAAVAMTAMMDANIVSVGHLDYRAIRSSDAETARWRGVQNTGGCQERKRARYSHKTVLHKIILLG